MCLIALAWRQHPRWPLVVAANRDEFHARPTANAGVDPDAPWVYGGRDLLQGGGWLQLSEGGRLAAVTNVRDGRAAATHPRSRGWIVRDFVRGDLSAAAVAAGSSTADGYGPFNALFWDGASLVHASNHPGMCYADVSPGIHAMSNGAFDAPWPKSMAATRALDDWLCSMDKVLDPPQSIDAYGPLFDALADTSAAPDAALPDTGVGLALERMLSPPFVRGEAYGTRCSTLVVVGDRGAVFVERRYGPGAHTDGDSLAFVPLAAVVRPRGTPPRGQSGAH